MNSKPTTISRLGHIVMVSVPIAVGLMFAISVFDDGIVDTFGRVRLDAGDRVVTPHGDEGTIVAEPEGGKVLVEWDAGGPPKYVHHDYLESR